MNLICTVDDFMGLSFHDRRQSSDRYVTDRILSITKNGTLWVSHYSSSLFQDIQNLNQLNIDDNCMLEAAPGEYCFIEKTDPAFAEKWIETLILFRWNRKYPADTYFTMQMDYKWVLSETADFSGYSHEKITMEVYKHV